MRCKKISKHFWLRSFALTIVRDPLRIVGQMSTEESKQKFLLECVESEQQKESDRLISGPRNTSFQRVQVFNSKLVATCCERFDVGAWPTTLAWRSSAVVKVIGANLSFGILWGTWLSPPKRFWISSPNCFQSRAVFYVCLPVSCGLLGRVVALQEVPWRLPLSVLWIVSLLTSRADFPVEGLDQWPFGGFGADRAWRLWASSQEPGQETDWATVRKTPQMKIPNFSNNVII